MTANGNGTSTVRYRSGYQNRCIRKTVNKSRQNYDRAGIKSDRISDYFYGQCNGFDIIRDLNHDKILLNQKHTVL